MSHEYFDMTFSTFDIKILSLYHFYKKAMKITKRVPLYIREVIGSYDSGILCKKLFRNLVLNNFSLQELVILQKNYFHKICSNIPVLNSKKIFVKKVRHTEKKMFKPIFLNDFLHDIYDS